MDTLSLLSRAIHRIRTRNYKAFSAAALRQNVSRGRPDRMLPGPHRTWLLVTLQFLWGCIVRTRLVIPIARDRDLRVRP
jgi:hypothetical protein